MDWRALFVSFAVLVSSTASFATAVDAPDPDTTPGKTCTSRDADFSEYKYSAHVAICTRNVSTAEKQKVADAYGGIPKSSWKKYEFDHLIPLCAGGANSIENIWPQPIAQAKKKTKSKTKSAPVFATAP